jgi:hypothetical protein
MRAINIKARSSGSCRIQDVMHTVAGLTHEEFEPAILLRKLKFIRPDCIVTSRVVQAAANSEAALPPLSVDY